MATIPHMEYYNELLHLINTNTATKVLESEYSISGFGSWYIDYEFSKNNFQIRWDGKGRKMLHSVETDEVWLNQNIHKDLMAINEAEIPKLDILLKQILANPKK